MGPAPALLAMYAGALAVVLWCGPPPLVATLAGWIGWGGYVTGMLAGYGCAVALILMSRVPVLDRGVGTDRLARWHAATGRRVTGLAAAHAVLAAWRRAMLPGGLAGLAGPVTVPWLAEAVISLVIMLAVGAVSARTVRRRLPYDAWHLLHLLVYPAVGLGFAHQLTGPHFAPYPLARAVWWGLYLCGGALLLWYRFVTPGIRSARHGLRVAGVRREAPGVVSVYVTGRRVGEIGAEPGQFFRWRFLAPGLWWSAKPYSLSAPPGSTYLRITVKGVGPHSRALAHLRPGTRVWVEGPYGALTAARRSRSRVLLLAGGAGIGPLRALFETLPGDVRLIYLARRKEDVILRRELDAIAASRGAPVLYAFDALDVPDPSDVAGALDARDALDESVTDAVIGYARHGWQVALTGRALRAAVPGLARFDVYVCGPPGMTAAACRALRRAGVPRGRIHLESFEF
ncbi:ferric reductase-like transmembrane domain-containing protein [Nonomuraea lactucae]|uniref:ferredoxin reductase family protein n=1 Tax=Nonomuraea lactucae TaxID=2249762 RepID=UPI00196640A4|nr:ferric reductase-like transmembrane domain-containing protein [Nonomuraea lactucae]